MRIKTIVAILFLAGIFLPANSQVGLFIRPNSSSLSAPVSGQTWLFNSTNNTLQVYNGSIFQIASAPQNNFTAVLAPTTANDNTQGYSPASLWYNTDSGNTYECVDATTSAAVWIQTNNLGSLSIPLTAIQQGSATTGQALVWNGTQWVASTQNIALSNILQSGSVTGQVPIWNGTAWIPGNPPGGSASVPLSQLGQSGATDGQVATWVNSDGMWEAQDAAGGLPSGNVNNQLLSSLSGSPLWVYGFSGISSPPASPSSLAITDSSYQTIDTSGGEVDIALPAISSSDYGKVFYINNDPSLGANNVVVSPNGLQTINGINSSVTIGIGQTLGIIAGATEGHPNWYSLLPITAYGGTSSLGSASNGQLLIGNGSGFSLNTLSAGTGLSITNTSGHAEVDLTTAGGAVNNRVLGYVSGSPMWTAAFTGINTVPYTSNRINLGNNGPTYNMFDTTSGALTATMVQLSSIGNGMIVMINNYAGGNNLVISPHSGGDVIDGGAITLTPGQICAIISDSDNGQWHIVQKPN